MVTVIRDKMPTRLHEEEIFTGDIMKLEIGMVESIEDRDRKYLQIA